MTDEDNSNTNQSNDNAIRKKDLFLYVAENTSLNKKDAREAVEATLSFLRQEIADEKEVIVPPLGKITSKRVKVGTPEEKVVYKLKLRAAETAL